MSRKTHVSHNDPFIKPQYANWLSLMIECIQPKDLYLVAGRATAKTAEIIAQRSQNIMYDMPHSQQIFVSDTHVNAMLNIMPTLFEGWERKGWKLGRDYVTDQRPPKHFKACYKPTNSFLHTVSVKTGVRLILGSLDQPSGLAGNSYQHLYGDESRILKHAKLKKINPAIRGEHAQFGHSVFYRGKTFTTDMPNILNNDDDWILGHEKDMNIDQIKVALQAGVKLNQVKLEMYNAQLDQDEKKVALLLKQVVRWTEKWIRLRMDSVFFYMVSSFVNSDVLQAGYFKDQLIDLGPEEFKSAVLSFKVDLKKGEKFYGSLSEQHFIDDGVNTSYYDKYKLTDSIEESSLALRYIDHNKPLDGSIDFGDMCSMPTGQYNGRNLYFFKEFYTLAPESSRELAAKFRNFYKHHKVKILNLYYDRSGNQYQYVKRDWASEVKNEIEFVNGSSTGWKVNLISRNQATILQEEEYNFVRQLLDESNPNLPKVRIDIFGCKCMKSSLELTKILVKVDTKTGRKTIHKDKSSEKLPLASRPMFSTNFSDAFKYFVYRPEWVKYTKRNTASFSGSGPGVF
ncbi:MAG: hypothetical protein V4581_14415 [Bacteroidota bacterium]